MTCLLHAVAKAVVIAPWSPCHPFALSPPHGEWTVVTARLRSGGGGGWGGGVEGAASILFVPSMICLLDLRTDSRYVAPVLDGQGGWES
jgi:hypothetical protein